MKTSCSNLAIGLLKQSALNSVMPQQNLFWRLAYITENNSN